MKFPPLQISWDPPKSHQHFLLYLPTSSQEIRHCCWCWFSSVKYSSLSGFSPTRSMSFDGLPKIRWKWNPLKWKQWSPKGNAAQGKPTESHQSRQGPRIKQTPKCLQGLGLLPSTHVHTEVEADEPCESPRVQMSTHLADTGRPVSYTVNSLEHL